MKEPSPHVIVVGAGIGGLAAVGQWQNPLAATLRDALFLALPGAVQQCELAPILDGRP